MTQHSMMMQLVRNAPFHLITKTDIATRLIITLFVTTMVETAVLQLVVMAIQLNILAESSGQFHKHRVS